VPLRSEEILMQTWIYKRGEQKGIERGIEHGMEKGTMLARKALVPLSDTRFGAMPAELRERVQAARDLELVERWCDLVSRGTREDVNRALGEG